MSALSVFTYTDERQIRAFQRDGEVEFAAADLCAALDIRNSRDALGRLDDDEKGVVTADTLGGPQQIATVNEAGMYSLILTSRKPEAKAFKRWITHEVIPSIRKTGAYGQPAAMSFEEMTAHVIHGLTAKIAELEAPAAAWTSLADADGDWTVSDAAKVLARDGIATGPRKLFEWLEESRWIFRRGGRWVAMQSAVNAGYLVERITGGYFDQNTGERKQADPQIRVTPKGLERLRQRLSEQRSLALVEDGA